MWRYAALSAFCVLGVKLTGCEQPCEDTLTCEAADGGSAGSSDGGDGGDGAHSGVGGMGGSGGSVGGLAIGENCGTASECESGFCANGVCCTTACDGDCFTCDGAGSVGECTPTAAGDPPSESTCDGKCDGFGTCASGSFVWQLHEGEAAYQTPKSVATGADGSSVVCGVFDGTFNLGGTPLTAVDGQVGDELDIFVLRLDSSGQHVWSGVFGDGATDLCADVAVDSQGNMVLVGHYNGSIDFGDGVINVVSGSDLYITKLNADGSFDWTVSAGSDAGTGVETATVVDVDSQQAVVAGGYFSSTIVVSGLSISNESGTPEDIWVARHSASGSPIFVRNYGGSAAMSLADIATDPDDNIIITGYFDGTVDMYDGHSIVSSADQDIFIAKLSAAGETLWAKSFGEAGLQSGVSVDVDTDGNIYLLASIDGPVDFGGASLTAQGNGDVAVASFDKDGAHRWSERYGDDGLQYGRALSVDAVGNVTIGGTSPATVNFGGSDITAQLFVAKFTTDGVPLWSHGYGDGANTLAELATDTAGNVVVVGQLSGALDFGGGPLNTISNNDLFVVKLTP